ncbi:MAG: hypothetical protein DLM73_01800 [Chthoniobacterales bacterium]|nr:MAG: hypothetical protein DLM73_01800 [Chthoniobacterales bacterium]
MKPSSGIVYEFGEFRFEPVNHLLSRRDGTPVLITPRVFDTLLYLVEHHDTVLDKERLMEAVWPDSIVEENNLSQNISTLRRIFGEDPGSHRFIDTVPGRGYRFIAEVKIRGGETEPERKAETAVELGEGTREAESVAAALPPASAVGGRKRWPVLVSALVVVALGAVSFFLWRSRPQSVVGPQPPISATNNSIPEKSIAVLQFDNLSDDKQNSYFAAAVQDEILTDLAKIADLKVISRISAGLYKSGNPRNSREIGQQLGVAYLLEGNMQRFGDQVRVNAQLIDTRTDTHIWSQTYDRHVADVFALQSEIAQSIAAQLQARISPTELADFAQPSTIDLTAKALYEQALELEFKPPQHENLLQAVRLLEEAVARDPRFVLAYCAAARMHLDLYLGGYDHAPARRELADAAIKNAARIQPDAGEVHLASAQYWFHGFRDYDRARTEIDLARRTLPNDPKVCFITAAMDRRQGRWSEAVRNFERAVELDPLNVEFLMSTGGTDEGLHSYAEARQMFERASILTPRDSFVRISRASPPLDARADIRPLRSELNAIMAEEPQAAPEIADVLFDCALIERDPAAVSRALAVMPAEGISRGNFMYPREWFAGLAARTFHDSVAARTSFTAARTILDKIVREQPDYAPAWSLLGRVDAGLGRKEEAVQEGRRACELLPLSKDAWFAPGYIRNLAWIYAWTGNKELALEQLEFLQHLQRKQGLHYGWLRLHPEWDSLRGDPRFEKIVASLAPKN